MTSHPDTVAWCEARNHPWSTYNPWLDRTWCRCGARVADGHQPIDFRTLHEEDHTCDYDRPETCRCRRLPSWVHDLPTNPEEQQ